ncbi:putative phosphoribosyl transferase [Roseovarius pacificus]|uniref:Putative phosphoribosyl transferase n=1 Tax=Roseovarius pacificus TaxID=337701 RepID=A0A1M6WI14_9RHOB|nr:phosphoribosyltransferase family protein [Roseovarius pacificus]GGO53304.1 phosphoribosyl transferase [Roseovarius pacificus]SHK93357.1 putative phosphoribosyl transferase [Roseovarius pacificus]
MTIYQDREDAARQVLEALPPLMDDDIVVLALPRGGVPIGAVIARALNVPLDLLLVRKVGAPQNPELAIGAVTGPGNDGLVVNESVAQLYGLTREDVARLAEPELDELERRRQAYLGQRPKVPVRGKTVILVDDGIATGTTVRSALVALRQQRPKRIILAVPVACADVLADLENQVDRIVCPEPHLHFGAVGGAYRVFDQVADSMVIDLMQQDFAT